MMSIAYLAVSEIVTWGLFYKAKVGLKSELRGDVRVSLFYKENRFNLCVSEVTRDLWKLRAKLCGRCFIIEALSDNLLSVES